MRLKRSAIILLLAVFHLTVHSQNAIVKGQLVDSAEHRNLQHAVISLLNAKDSVLVRYGRADEKGNFTISNADTGHYVIMITHPYFADIFDSITLAPSQTLDLGILNMLSKLKMLEEVVVKSGAPIRVKGDTTIYTADSFKVRDGANVEELLKKLPGIQVDKDGKITAMGETVKNVLVDGEEFFGSDPGIATKNLDAKNIQEVQVYDKKSDQATFTGIDDGSKEKTINLKLKDNAKKGYFGKAEAGGGTDGRFNNSLMANSFKNKRKLSAYGIMSNTGNLNLNWDDETKYGGGSNVELMDGGGIAIFSGGDNYNYSGGIPTNWNWGLNYSNKFNQDKNSLNTSYKGVKINAPDSYESNSRTYLADSVWSTNNRSNSYGTTVKNNINGTFESKIDSANTIKITAKAYSNSSKNYTNFYSESLTPENGFINKNYRASQNESDKYTLNTTALWMHKFKKANRTFSFNIDVNLVDGNSKGQLNSNLVFYNNGDSTGNSRIDQRNSSRNNSQNYTAKATYTEPLFKDSYLELSYSALVYKSAVVRDVFDKGADDQYNTLIDSLSNHYNFDYLGHSPGANFKITKKKYNFTVGGAVGFYNYRQNNTTLGVVRKYNFTNYFPRANFQYKFKPSESLSIYYNGRTSAPNIDDLQPILVNTDPLNIKTGNPLLKPSFTHNLSLNFNSYNMLKDRYIGGYISWNLTQNAFSTLSSYRDSIRVYQTVNTNGVTSVYGGMWGGIGFKKAHMRLNFNPQLNYNKGVDLIERNGIVNQNTSEYTNISFNTYLSKNKDSVYDLGIGPKIVYTNSHASINTASNVSYFNYGITGYVWFQLPLRFEIRSDVDVNLQKKDARFKGSYNYTVWNATLSKKIAKNKFEVKASVNDILNQNQRYTRNISGSMLYEQSSLLLRRYALLSFLWNFTNNNTKAPSSN
ncbi:hypothetical protein A8C56_04620 [Niabella ginsenosidivorans]|uniref:Outer membrane protein beta-barrel domain-containing protein n=1 Tax=Niabella ginsenosidivorans TaxID=1176587 RepID=A0A1A9HY52_9BACT|nr:outer membrane beta-barrel family protein [Niabella ginsenosidivorans]ANH80358.1 hypothetical protein A8C56_04620 [Niabella ginsenosidivorans]